MACAAACGGGDDPAARDAGTDGALERVDGAAADGGAIDGGSIDAGSSDAASHDAATLDAGEDGGPPCAAPATPDTLTTYTSIHVPTAIAVGRDGTVAVTFSSTSSDLHVGTNASGVWVMETIDLDPHLYLGTTTTVAVDDAGAVHVVFRDGSTVSWAHYVTNASGSWLHTMIPTPGRPTSFAIAIDGAGAVHVATLVGNDVHYVTNATGVWTSAPVNEDICATVDIDVTAGVQLAYTCRTDPTAAYDVLHAELDGGGAFVETLVAPAIALSGRLGIGVASDGSARIVYPREADNTLGLATETAGTFSNAPLAGTTQLQGLAVSTAGAAHVLHGYHAPGLSYGTDASGTWSTAVIEDPWAAGRAAIAIGADGRVHVADHAVRAVDATVAYRWYCP